MLDGSAVLLTGGTGSFGKAFVREALERHSLRRLVIFSRDEQKQFEMAREFPPEAHPCLRYFIGDVRDLARLRLAMRGIDTVVHAAAMKHVPIAEYNPFECIRTNIGGAENVINAAIDNKVKRVIALSTDKAANPINLYGATKLASDKCFVAANNLAGAGGPRFSVVRYGNVVGSRGSVVEYWRRLLADGKTELPVTDLRMTRFWITLQRGVEFVLECLERMAGGEIFVPRIKSLKLETLAKTLAPNCSVREVGIRPGEKLHEILIPSEESRNTLAFPDHFLIQPAFHWWDPLKHLGDASQGGVQVPDDFEYASNTNEAVLEGDDLLEMFGE